MFCNVLVFKGEELLAHSPTPQDGGLPLVCYPRQSIYYIRSGPPYSI
jgi:hypothetical protein